MDQKQEDALLTIGEAAEFAGVALIDLREHIRAGRLVTFRGQRLGDELPLLSLETLIHIYPAAARRRHRPLRSLADRGIAVVEGPGRRAPAALEGGHVAQQGMAPRPSASEVRASHARAQRLQVENAAALANQALAGTSEAGSEAGQVAEDVEQLERQIEDLRKEVDLARIRNQDLLLDLDSASADAQRMLDDSSEPALHRRQMRDRVQREQQELDQALSHLDQGSSLVGWGAAAAAVVAGVLLVLWVRGPVHAASVAPDPPGVDRVAMREASVVRSLRTGALIKRQRAEERQARLDQMLVAPKGLASPEALEAEQTTGEAVSSEAGGGSVAAPGVGGSGAQSKQAAGSQSKAAEKSGGGRQQPAEAQLAVVSAGDPCEIYPLTSAGQPLREILGPCMGGWNPSAKSVVGVHRQDGKTWCRQHYMIARELAGSIVRAKEIAEFAENEGLIPPLVQLRVDRAAAASLTARAGSWIESGFESGSPSDHRVTRLVGRDRWRVESWVRLAGKQAKEGRRRFRMQLELNDTELLDRELEFVWLD